MSQYTISLNEFCKIHHPDSVSNIDKKIEYLRKDLFNFAYENDSEFKEQFETLFVVEYIENDINIYDVDLWKKKLELFVKLKSPFYFQKWKYISNLNPDDYILLGESESESTGKSTSETSSSGENKNINSDFPQNLTTAGSKIAQVKYASSGSQGENESSSKGKAETSQKSITKSKGNVKDFLDYFSIERLNIVQDFVNDLRELFILIY